MIIETMFSYFLENLNYFSIALLMAIESSFIPFPSEVIMIPAGFLAHQGKLNIFLAIISGIFGSIIGALINYYIGLKLGRHLILKYKKFLFINIKHLEWSEKYFKKHGNKTTFFCRLIPAVRQYISIPAGFAKMDLKEFILYTVLGAGLWVVILTYFGYFLGLSLALNVVHIINYIMYGLLGLILLAIAIVYLFKKIKSKNRKH